MLVATPKSFCNRNQKGGCGVRKRGGGRRVVGYEPGGTVPIFVQGAG